jgi:hypothetical protein
VQEKEGVMTLPSSRNIEIIYKYLEFFADLVIQEYDFLKFKSHELSVAIILAARKGAKFVPVWNPALE